MTVACIHQPNLFPRLKVLQKIAKSDLWVVFDNVQFMAREWQNRARFRHYHDTRNCFWVTVPVHRPNGQASLIQDIEICDYASFKRNFLKSISATYKNSPFLGWVEDYCHRLASRSYTSFGDLANDSTSIALNMVGLDKPMIASSSIETIDRARGQDRTDRLIGICEAVGASRYLSGSGGMRYLKPEKFVNGSVSLLIQRWENPAADEMLDWRNISFLDYVARFGPDAMLSHIHGDVAW